MKYEDVLEIIKTRGYWRISFEPLTYTPDLFSLSKIKSIVRDNALNLRGWDYPHIPSSQTETSSFENGQNYWQGWDCWPEEKYKEFWRIYQSGQFIQYLALREDWTDPSTLRNVFQTSHNEQLASGSALGMLLTIFQITEIYEFLFRLISNGFYETGVNVSITLFNTRGRRLYIDDSRRIGFSVPYRTAAEEITFSEVFSREKIIDSSKDESLRTILYFFERFGWENISREVIRNDQERLFSKNF